MKLKSDPRRGRRGQTTLLFSIASVVMFGMLGLVVDLGWAYYRKQVAQAAAQSAAIAAVAAAVQSAGTTISCGAVNVSCQAETPCGANDGIDNTGKGCLYAADNGFSTGGRQKVTIAAGTGTPPTGNGADPQYWVTVRASESIPQLFSAVLGDRYATVSARATAGYFPPPMGGCVYVLNPTGQAMLINGNILFQTGCGVNIASTYYAALKMVGSAQLIASSGSKINVVGGYTADTNSTVTPLPTTGAPLFSDPLGDIPPPTVGSCDSYGVSLGNNDKQTISPGVYCGPITVTGHAILTLSPGMYISTLGGLSVGGQATLNGTGVSMYFQTNSAGFAGGATSNLTAPASGPWQGVLFFQDRNDTTSATLVGGSGQSMSGILYFPKASLSYTAGSTTTAQSATIICNTLNITGNSYIAQSGNSPLLTLFSGIGILE
jgi:Flp pilus assembly protein TadG